MEFKHRLRTLWRDSCAAEQQLWQALQSVQNYPQLNHFHFVRHLPFDELFVDFLCPPLKLGIVLQRDDKPAILPKIPDVRLIIISNRDVVDDVVEVIKRIALVMQQCLAELNSAQKCLAAGCHSPLISPSTAALRQNAAMAETLLLREISARQLQGFKFRRQSGAEPMSVEFVCTQLKLVIRLCCDHFCADSASRSGGNAAEHKGYHVARVRHSEVLHNLVGVIEALAAVIRQCLHSRQMSRLACRYLAQADHRRADG